MNPIHVTLTTFEGGNALSDFRASGLLARLREVAPQLTGVSARHVHWVASAGALPPETAATVARLLTYGRPYDAPTSACLLYTSPSPRDRTRSRMPSSA